MGYVRGYGAYGAPRQIHIQLRRSCQVPNLLSWPRGESDIVESNGQLTLIDVRMDGSYTVRFGKTRDIRHMALRKDGIVSIAPTIATLAAIYDGSRIALGRRCKPLTHTANTHIRVDGGARGAMTIKRDWARG